MSQQRSQKRPSPKTPEPEGTPKAPKTPRTRKMPKPARPAITPGYGISKAPKGLLPWAGVEPKLAAARNYWVASTRPDGRPHAMPVWGIWHNGAFYFSTDPASRKGRNLAANPETVVHLESGDDVVFLEGRVETVRDPAELASFADAYQAKYQFRPDVADNSGKYAYYRLALKTAYAWHEKDFPTSATRWRFDVP